jgi:hypothetical protein
VPRLRTLALLVAAAPVLLLGAAALSTAAAGATAYVSYKQAGAAADAEKYNAKVAANEAQTVTQQTTAAENVEQAKKRDFLANATATTAETGVGLSGSRAQVLGQSAEDSEYQTLLTRYQGKLQASGLTGQAALLRTQAANSQTYGKEALFTGMVSAGAQGLAGYGRSRLGPQAQTLGYGNS